MCDGTARRVRLRPRLRGVAEGLPRLRLREVGAVRGLRLLLLGVGEPERGGTAAWPHAPSRSASAWSLVFLFIDENDF